MLWITGNELSQNELLDQLQPIQRGGKKLLLDTNNLFRGIIKALFDTRSKLTELEQIGKENEEKINMLKEKLKVDRPPKPQGWFTFYIMSRSKNYVH